MALGDGVLLAVSGGADSIALLHSTVELWGRKSSSIVVGHVNHNLRGVESQRDEEFVGEVAADLGVRFQSIRLESGQLSDQPKVTLEEAARNSRYNWLTKLAVELGTSFVVTAHHADDQAETVLHNIVRGAGLRGLRGMRSSRKLPDERTLIRPMLGIHRVEIDAFLDRGGCEFRFDPSNLECQFTRNKIRQDLLPLLQAEFNPQVVKNLNSLSLIADETAEFIEQLAEELISESIHHHDSTSCRLNVAPFLKWPSVVIRQSLILLWDRLNWPRKKMTSRHWKQLADLTLAATNSEFDLPGFVHAERSGTLLRLTRKTDSSLRR